MKYIKGILASSHLDLEGDKLSKEFLEDFVKQANENIILNSVKHDPRIPPIGRLISAKLIEYGDGEFGVEGKTELFENDYSNIINLGDRKVLFIENSVGEFRIQYDKGYEEDDILRPIEEIGNIFQADISKSIKKSIDPVYVLIIAGGFFLNQFAGGFLKELGKDSYILFKKKLKEIYNKKNKSKNEFLLKFEFSLFDNEKKINFEFILSNPNEIDIDTFLDKVLPRGNEFLKPFFEIISEKPIKRIIFEVINGELKFIFGIRDDGIPISLIKLDSDKDKN